LHLSRVEAIGFKSFANKVNVEFNPGVNGIVGPNGCGKSNITDAIKWVLGEQSAKSLRASNMTSVIFNGDELGHYKKQNFAQVSLIFDNSDHSLNIDFDTVEITRRLYRNGESEYLINKSPSRLKDIVELIMDTGLGKDSLSMISQGAINNFAESKPEERRAIFEEAAGVAKYKKKKIESLRKLEKTNDNIVRLSDIIAELEAQIEPLKNQAIKAKQYKDAKEKLEGVEVSVLVFDIDAYYTKLNQAKITLADLTSDLIVSEKELENDERLSSQIDESYKACNSEVLELQANLLKISKDIEALQKEKAELNNQVFENSDEQYIGNLKSKLDEYKLAIETDTRTKSDFEQKKESVGSELTVLNQQESQLNSHKQRLTSQSHQINTSIRIIENDLNSTNNLYAGVRAVLNNKAALGNIIGIVKDLFSVNERYAQAIVTVLNSVLQNVVVESSEDAKYAAQFLKENRAGFATFWPLDMVKDRYLNDNDLYIAQQSEGFVDVAVNLISFEPKFEVLFNQFLNQTLVVDSIENAIILGKRINNRARIVTLDGEVINTTGSIAGGRGKNDTSNPLTLKSDLEKAKQDRESVARKLDEIEDALSTLIFSKANLTTKLNQYNISIGKLETTIDNNQALFNTSKNEYEGLTNLEYNVEESITGIDLQLAILSSEKDNVVNDIGSKHHEASQLSSQLDDLKEKIKTSRKSINAIKDDMSMLKIDNASLEANLKNALDTLATDYKLTMDRAREVADVSIDVSLAKEEVTRYKRIIKSLGYVNHLAIEEYEKVKERFDFLSIQMADLENSRNDILKIINDTDKVMVTKFDETIQDINAVLPDTFKKLFGGGMAKLEYTDPTNILDTGIEIIARPPGKNINNLISFSGGEKALIALSVLFSIIKVRPIPLCILDEVEAALDIANVEKFARYLKEFAQTTQFIVITHRPGTMEQCDVLYGVTMQEPGVTKMIGVQLKDAIGLADESEEA